MKNQNLIRIKNKINPILKDLVETTEEMFYWLDIGHQVMKV